MRLCEFKSLLLQECRKTCSTDHCIGEQMGHLTSKIITYPVLLLFLA